MGIKRAGKIGIFIVAVVLVLAFVNKNTETTEKKPRVKRTSRFYNGINEKPVYSKVKINVSAESYQFPPVLQGDRIEHDFFVKNDSTKMIEFSEMKSCCGFILTDFPDRIFPGEEGKISLIVFTDKFGGKNIQGKLQADLLGHEQKVFNLDVSVFVKKIASISHHKIILKGAGDQRLEGHSLILPEADFPFDVTGIKAKKGLHIEYGVRTVEKNGRNGFQVFARNTQTKQRVYRDMLFVQTDSPTRPEIRIRVEGHISGPK